VPLTIPLLFALGSEFMPPLYEGSLLYMPTSPPGMSITEATRQMQIQDRILKQFPEVITVHGKAGRSETATDPAPLEMFETTIRLKPRDAWRPGMTTEALVAELDADGVSGHALDAMLHLCVAGRVAHQPGRELEMHQPELVRDGPRG